MTPGAYEHDEIATGPGPGAVFASQVRGWQYDGSSVAMISKVNFVAYAAPNALNYGVKVAGGSLRAGEQHLVTAPGPGGTSYAPLVQPWQVDLTGTGGGVSIVGGGTSAFTNRGYGANVAVTDLDGDGDDDILAGEGPDPRATSRARGYLLTPNGVDLDALPGLDFFAFENLGLTHGVTVTGSPTYTDATSPNAWLDARLRVLHRALLASADSTYVCHCCDPETQIPAGYWSDWASDAQRELAIAQATDLLAKLPDLRFDDQIPTGLSPGVVERLDALRDLAMDSQLGITNPGLLADVLEQIAELRGFYAPPRFLSTAVTGEVTDIADPSNMVLSQPYGKVIVDPILPPPPFPGPGPAPVVHVVDVKTADLEEDVPLPTDANSAVSLLVGVPGRPEVYAVTQRPFLCPPGATACPQPFAADFLFERVRYYSHDVFQDSGYVYAAQSLAMQARAAAAYVTPPTGTSALLGDTGYLSVEAGVTIGDPGSGEGYLFAVEGMRDFDDARVINFLPAIPGRKPVYEAFAPSPDLAPALADRLYAAHEGSIDAVRTNARSVVADVLAYPAGFGPPTAMSSGTTATGRHRLYVTSDDELLAYEPAAAEPLVSQVLLAPGITAVHLSLDGRYVLVTRRDLTSSSPRTVLAVVDADTLLPLRESTVAACDVPPCTAPKMEPMALTIDGSHAFVSIPNEDRLAYVYLGPSHLPLVARTVSEVVAAVPVTAFTAPQRKQKMIHDVGKVQQFLELAERAPNEHARQAHLADAAQDLASIVARTDGCAGGNPADDVITVCAEAASVLAVATELADGMAQQTISDCPTQTFP